MNKRNYLIGGLLFVVLAALLAVFAPSSQASEDLPTTYNVETRYTCEFGKQQRAMVDGYPVGGWGYPLDRPRNLPNCQPGDYVGDFFHTRNVNGDFLWAQYRGLRLTYSNLVAERDALKKQLETKPTPKPAPVKVQRKVVYENPPAWKVAKVLPLCKYKDSNDCKWFANVQGNGRGNSFINLQGNIYYLP